MMSFMSTKLFLAEPRVDLCLRDCAVNGDSCETENKAEWRFVPLSCSEIPLDAA